MEINSTISNRIKNMSLFCAAMVCFIHIHPARDGGWTRILDLYVREGFCRAAVPYFFFISGYFLAAHYRPEGGWWGVEIVKRLRTLLIPYILICALTFLLNALFQWSMDAFTFEGILDGLGITSIYPEPAGHMWYIRCLFLMVLISPVFIWCMRENGFIFLYVAAVLILLVSMPAFLKIAKFFRGEVSAFGLFFFPFGIWCQMHEKKLWIHQKGRFWKGGVALAIGIMVLIAKFYMLHVSWVPLGLFEAMMVPPVLFGLWLWMPDGVMPSWLERMSFPIYCLHPLFILFGRARIWHSYECPTVRMCLLMWILSLLGSVAVACLFQRLLPRTYSIIFGNR